MAEASYIHGTSPTEQTRLGLMNRLLNKSELDTIGLGGHERALELGAGTGIFAQALAERLPRGSLVAVELDARQLATARASSRATPNLDLRQGDVVSPPLGEREWGSFDLVHARFLLEHLTRPGEAVKVMARAVRPGGRVVLVDDDHDTLRLWPEAPRFQELWRAYCDQYSLRGMDPWIGRRLVSHLVAADLEPVRATMLFFGACAGMELFQVVVENMLGVVKGATEDILRSGSLSAEAARSGLDEMSEWRRARDASLWYALPFAEGMRPLR